MARFYTYLSRYEKTVNLVMRWTCPYCGKRQLSLNQIKLFAQADNGFIDKSKKIATSRMDKYSRKLDCAVRETSLSKLKLQTKCGNCHRKPIWSRYIFFRSFDRGSSFWLVMLLAVIICAIITPPGTLAVPVIVFSIACAPYILKHLWNAYINLKLRKMPYDQIPTVGYLDDESETVKSCHFPDNVGVLIDNVFQTKLTSKRKGIDAPIRNTELPVRTNRTCFAEENRMSLDNNDETNRRLFESAQVLISHIGDTQSISIGRSQLAYLADKKNYVPAMLFLADIEKNEGNEDEVCRLLQKAADSGDSDGQLRFARFLLTASERNLDLPLAFAYCEKAAHQGNPDAWFLLGDFYKISNPQRAEQYYKRARDICGGRLKL